MPARLLLVAAVALAAGCIEHRVRVRNPADPGHADQAMVGGAIVERFASPDEIVVDSGPVPHDATVDAWRRDELGAVLRWTGHVRTPLPWWQRFPCDIATDVWPRTLVCQASGTVACAPVAVVDPDRLAASAARDGYARPAPPAVPPPQQEVR